MSKLFFYIAIGKLSIYFIQIFPPVELLYRVPKIGKYLEKLIECDLCLGVWVYWFLAFFFSVNYMQEWFYVPVLCELLTGAITSFIMHLISIGWKEKFGVFEVN